MGEKGDSLREIATLADEEEELQSEQQRLTEDLKRTWLSDQSISSHFDVEKKLSLIHISEPTRPY